MFSLTMIIDNFLAIKYKHFSNKKYVHFLIGAVYFVTVKYFIINIGRSLTPEKYSFLLHEVISYRLKITSLIVVMIHHGYC